MPSCSVQLCMYHDSLCHYSALVAKNKHWSLSPSSSHMRIHIVGYLFHIQYVRLWTNTVSNLVIEPLLKMGKFIFAEFGIRSNGFWAKNDEETSETENRKSNPKRRIFDGIFWVIRASLIYTTSNVQLIPSCTQLPSQSHTGNPINWICEANKDNIHNKSIKYLGGKAICIISYTLSL